MSGIHRLLDTTTKRWLAVLAAAAAVFVAVLVHSLVTTLYPSAEPIVTVELPAREIVEPVSTRTEPSWNSTQPASASLGDQLAPVERTSPFEAQRLAKQQTQELLQNQADYFKKVMVNGKLPANLGGLTKEQVDDMQKKGILME